MGLLRILLALSVVLNHLGPIFGFTLLNGKIAVESFFIISGFYMSLILNEKYIKKNGSYRLYITNRFLRIYPVYWFVLALTFIFMLTQNSMRPLLFQYFNNFAPFGSLSVFSTFTQYIFKNVFIFSTVDYFVLIPKIYDRLLVGQAWTLGIELTFYLIAPFITRLRIKSLIFLIFLAILIRVYATHYAHFYPDDQVDYFFIPNFIFFCLGIASYYLYLGYRKINIQNSITVVIIAIFFIITLLFNFIPVHLTNTPFLLQWLFYILLLFMLPVLFVHQGKNKLMMYLGDITYPLYICHLLVIYILQSLMINKANENLYRIIGVVVCIFFAIILNRYIANPIDKYRQARIKAK
jgi:peptidoglycan/LPS O-acetylase OafA/YrhL